MAINFPTQAPIYLQRQPGSFNEASRVVYVDPKLIASREQSARLAAHERALNAHNAAKVKTKNEKVAIRKAILMKPITQSTWVLDGWLDLVTCCERISPPHLKFTDQEWLDVATWARTTAEATFIDPPLTDIEAAIIAQFAYAQAPNPPSNVGALYLGDPHTWVVSFDTLKALGIIRENEVADTPPQLGAAPVVAINPFDKNPYDVIPAGETNAARRDRLENKTQWDRDTRAELATKEAVAVGLTANPALAQNVQQMPVHLGLPIDPEDDKLSADEFAAKVGFGNSVLRANATHGYVPGRTNN